MDQIENLIDQAHRFFGQSSIFEVFDLRDRQEATDALVGIYGPVDMGKVERYLDILDRLRGEMEKAD